MWHKASLQIAGNMQALTCSVLPVHPWVYGVGRAEASGNYLSPQNAIDYLSGRLGGDGSEICAVVFMVCAPSHAEFMQLLGGFSSVLPLPVFGQVTRMAQTAATQAVTKMQLPASASCGLPAPQPLSTSTNRLALRAQRIAQAEVEAAAGASLGNLQSALAAFADARKTAMDGVAKALGELQGKSASAWVFTAKGNATTIAAEMLKNVPQPDAVFTLATLFAGDDLSTLEAMIHDDNHASA